MELQFPCGGFKVTSVGLCMVRCPEGNSPDCPIVGQCWGPEIILKEVASRHFRVYSDYLKEVTSCLSQTMVLLLQIRPPDPIEFIAHSLQNYRKLHPLPNQGGQPNKTHVLEQVITVTSPDTSCVQEELQEEDIGHNAIVAEVPDPELGPRIIERKDTGYIDACADEYGPHVVFVHQDDTIAMGTIGDLFDEDDFG